ncbi:alpha/beta fold hydrolase [Acinetobacter wanghuae]|uniref:Alpha/beta fold hydrolase n=1 Tax=Acinetobacter wanghuae TaxID=2662362 RepID=A0A5Q0P257_9GAMM|nr:alpha/beta hydrolase [Acinetobacter wanghuae]MQW92127.1 alpha/beta fold hydrolase [Acinetobacter wanghuae]QGA10702.1 alpha/beta fold hydrolase [Acinetobacter wanghuae]
MKQNIKNIALTVLCGSLLLSGCGSDDNDTVIIETGPVKTFNVDGDVAKVVNKHDVFTYPMMSVTGKMVTATTLVFTPKGNAPQGGWPIVVWAHGTTGAADKCAPSRLALASPEKQLIMGLVQKGYAVIAPDYEGLGNDNVPHPYLHLTSAANSILSAIHEARKFYGDELGREWSVIGWSQGGHAALAAAEYQKALLGYKFKGTVAIAPASYLAETLNYGMGVANQYAGSVQTLPVAKQIAGTLYGYAAIVSSGIKAANPTFNYNQAFLADKVDIAKNAELECSPQVAEKFRDDIDLFLSSSSNGGFSAYQALQPKFLLDADVRAYLSENLPAQNKITNKVYVYQGTGDTTVPAQITVDYLLPDLIAAVEKPDHLIFRAKPDATHQTIMTDYTSELVDTVDSLMKE